MDEHLVIDNDYLKLFEAYQQGNLADFDLLIFRKYLQGMEDFLDNESAKLDKLLNAVAEEMGAEKFVVSLKMEIPPKEVDYGFFYQEMTELYANTFRKSAFVSLYSHFEVELVPRVQAFSKLLNSGAITFDSYKRKSRKKSKSRENSGPKNTLELAVDYFKETLNFDMSPEDNLVWLEIKNFTILRNCIVHDSGVLDKKTRHRNDLEDYIYTSPYLSLDDDKILLNREFCFHVVDVFKKFFIILVEFVRGKVFANIKAAS
ncbi:MAG: hypothetical protein HC875_37115 [Anaerolineales bacterium]|nr:hypothetical protein [Anaerolineales bacterium]